MNRQSRRAEAAQRVPSSDPAAQEAWMALLEPIVAGIISGQKKLVIETRIQTGIGNYDHTIKVKDCNDT